MIRPRLVLTLALWMLGMSAYGAPRRATITVTNTNDSGAGSLRQAILDSNASVGVPDTITFNIPGAGVHTISPTSQLPTISDPVTIDGTTQPGYAGTPLIELDGTSAGASALGLLVYTGPSTIKGLAINRFNSNGIELFAGNNMLQSCHIGTDPAGAVARPNVKSGVFVSGGTAQIGGTAAGEGNVLSGNGEAGVNGSANGVNIQGNKIGTDISGTAAIPNVRGVLLSGRDCTVGGTVAGAGNVISGNSYSGLEISGFGTTIQRNTIGADASGASAIPNGFGIVSSAGGVHIGGDAATAGNLISGNAGAGVVLGVGGIVEGNRIGTDTAGTSALPNGGDGVLVQGSSYFTVIGYYAASLANTISGNTGNGVRITSYATLTTVAWNWIGTDSSGALALPNGGHGVLIDTDKNLVTLNTISSNGGAGIRVSGGTGNQITQNSIRSNSGLGIELGTNGIVPNDIIDSDVGPNNLQNFPVLSSAVNDSGVSTVVSGTLNSTPNMGFTVEFYGSATANPSGYGDGETYLDTINVTSDVNGLATISWSLPALPLGSVVTATVTDSQGNTSSFSPAVVVVADATAPSLQITGPVSSPTLTTNVTPLPLSGIASDNVGVTSVDWTNSAGGSGPAIYSAGVWNASIALSVGTNVITVTASDADGNFTSALITVILDLTAPTVAVTIPTTSATYSSTSTPLSVWGSASDDVGLASVTWSNSAGGSGTALGTTLWAAAVPLSVGSNVITVTATDSAGNTATATLTVDYTAPGGTTIYETTKKSCGSLGLDLLGLLGAAVLSRRRRRR